jgi:hypothetical protein
MLLAALGLLGLIIYLSIAHPTSLRPVTIAVQGASWVAVFARLTLDLARKRPRSRELLMLVISEAGLLLCITFGLLIDGADQSQWTHGPAGYAIAGAELVFLLAIAAYWLTGQRRLGR